MSAALAGPNERFGHTTRRVRVLLAVAVGAALVTSVACAQKDWRTECTWDGTAAQRGTAASADADPDIAVTVKPLVPRLLPLSQGTGFSLLAFPTPDPGQPSTESGYRLAPLLILTVVIEARKAGYTFDASRVHLQIPDEPAVFPHVIASEGPIVSTTRLPTDEHIDVMLSFRARLEPEAGAELVVGGLSYEGREIAERHLPLVRAQLPEPCAHPNEQKYFTTPTSVRACSTVSTSGTRTPAVAHILSVEVDRRRQRIVLWSGGVPQFTFACAGGTAPRLLDGPRLEVDVASGQAVCLEDASPGGVRRLAEAFRLECGKKIRRVHATSLGAH